MYYCALFLLWLNTFLGVLFCLQTLVIVLQYTKHFQTTDLKKRLISYVPQWITSLRKNKWLAAGTHYQQYL